MRTAAAPPTEGADVSALIRRIRAERKLTQEGLARTLGVSFATVNGWENGRHRPIPALARQLDELAADERESGILPAQSTAAPTGSQSTDAAPPAGGSAQALTGWPLEPQARRDLYHRQREFPADVARWKAGVVDRVMRARALFPSAPRGHGGAPGSEEQVEATRALVDDGISYLRLVAHLAALMYGTPDLGNKKDPVDELVYIILSRKTREDAYQQAFEALRSRFDTWDELLAAPRAEVASLLSPSGLGDKKTTSILGALGAIRDAFGSCTLEPARGWTDDRLEEFLCALPEIHRKSAYCVMMYAFGRSVLPVDTHVGRVLARLGPYRELGLDLAGLDHKQLQAILADLVPPNLRYSLHVNLVMHGREICRSQKPLCGECELRNLCRTYRASEAQRVESLEQPRVVDLFTGAGGLSEGFERAGFEIALALDADAVALRTYWLNHPAVRDERLVCRDIREVMPGELRRAIGRRTLDVLIGAPPCQGFSHVGQRSKSSLTGYRVTDDARNFLYTQMIRATLELRPRLFLMENVPGMKSARKGDHSFFDAAERALRAAGYDTATWRLNAAAFGVPQERFRFFLVAARSCPVPPRPHEAYQDSGAREFDHDALPPVTFDDAVFDLPQRGADDGVAVDLWPERIEQGDTRYRRYLSKFGLLSRSRFLFNHTVRYHNERDLELYALLRPGEDSVHALERHQRSDLMRYRSDVFDDKYARLRGDRPCKTIVAHLAKDGNGYIHHAQPRSISFREAARVQSFRDDYAFCGSPSDQWVQLGNAVPPVMAEAIARSFLAALQRRG